jgi:hypothetical protein
LETSGVAEMVVVSGNIAFMTTDWPGSLHVIDVSNPQTPLLLFSESLATNPSSLAVDGKMYFLDHRLVLI